jgi:predicted ATPase
MPHLKHIGLTNFRVFGERTDIALAPLTILTGTNSSGKSSVLKAMQLLQENIEDIGYLNFSHGEHKLGNFDMALNRNATDKTMIFSLPFEFKDMSEEMYMDWIYTLDDSNPLEYGKLSRLSICLKKSKHEIIGITPWDDFFIDFEYFHINRVVTDSWINVSESIMREYLRNHYLVKNRDIFNRITKEIKPFKTFNSENDFINYVISLISTIKDKFKLKHHITDDETLLLQFNREYYIYENNNQPMFLDPFKDTIRNLDDFLKSIGDLGIYDMLYLDILEEELDSKYFFLTSFWELIKQEDIYNVLNSKEKYSCFLFEDFLSSRSSIIGNITHILKEGLKMGKGFSKEFQKDNFYYLEAVRANTQRVYTWQPQGTAFNQLLFNLVKNQNDWYWQISFINIWLKEFGIGNQLKINFSEQSIGASISIDDKPLADLGYGVTQFLPILIKIVTIVKFQSYKSEITGDMVGDFFKKKILYIEEPETNLHPKLQSKLADMFIDACNKFNLQIIVETHSEYLIRKLQYLTAKEKIEPDMTVIHYFYDPKEERPEGEPQVKQINIQPDGRLTSPFGEGFYDETARLMNAILTGETLN